jgi:tellurite resistance protein TerC
MFVFAGEKYGSEFLAGWITEYSLSIDNLFVFVLIMSHLCCSQEIPATGVDDRNSVGHCLPGIFILLGAALIASFSWIFYVFGAFLIVIGSTVPLRP